MNNKPILFKNIKIIMENKVLNGYCLTVNNGVIEQIAEEGFKDNSCYTVIDGQGKYLSPGFIDIHNHGNSGFDTMDATPEALEEMSRFHLKNGVTGFLATTMTGSHKNTVAAINNAVSYMSKNINVGARLLGMYLEGPYFNMSKKGAQPPEYIKNTDVAELREYIELGRGCIKVVALAPELENAKEAIGLLRMSGITVSAGHSDATYEETVKGINMGITEATHLYNGMRAFSHRESGIIGACLLDERVYCEMICDGIHVSPSSMQIAVKMKGRDKLVLISDAMRAAGLKDGEYDLGGQTVTVKGSEARLADGTLAGSTLTLDKAVRNMVRLAKVPLCDAVKMASLNPAKSAGLADRKGSIAVGKDADLILFDENIRIEKVWLSGVETA
ncbi:MAG: N-acetylglucosamine-6-phosphate deacetylase [Oscillospiraceae bacterium]|nr:N-acetylglucosamine-6-phosphate deacetylase [Oscillospiraceae bacterium]